jgi:hypothetical protein
MCFMAGDPFEPGRAFWSRASQFTSFISELNPIAARRLLGNSADRTRMFPDRVLRVDCMVGPQF